MSGQILFGLHPNAVAYASTIFASAMMNSVYNFYYVSVFLNRYHVQESWFQIAQILFLVWNAVNDPLFGYFQDKHRIRQGAIRSGAFLFVLSFLVFWFPWTSDGVQHPVIVGIHLIVSLFFYDALFTYVLLAQCAIFAEISKVHSEKVCLIKYSQVASLIGATSVTISNLASNNLENYGNFQIVCVGIAILSWFFLRYSGNNTVIESDSSAQNLTSKKEGDDYSYFSLTLQIIREQNFISFVIVNLLSIFSITFSGNFTAIICNHLITESELSAIARSVFYGSMFVMPQIIVIFGSSAVSKFGYYQLMRWSFVVKIVFGTCMYLIGPNHHWFLMAFIIIDSTMCNANAMFSLYNLPLSDIIEEDLVKNKRTAPVSSTVFGTNALITKPAQSLAPMMAVWILNMYGYGRLQKGIPLTAPELNTLLSAMFNMVCLIPVVIGILQSVTWSFYKIRNTHTSSQKYIEV